MDAIEVLRRTPVKTTGVQTPDLVGSPQDDRFLVVVNLAGDLGE